MLMLWLSVTPFGIHRPSPFLLGGKTTGGVLFVSLSLSLLIDFWILERRGNMTITDSSLLLRPPRKGSSSVTNAPITVPEAKYNERNPFQLVDFARASCCVQQFGGQL